MTHMENRTTRNYLVTLLFSFFASYFALQNLQIAVNWTTLALAVIVIFALLSVPCNLKLDKKNTIFLGLFVLLLTLANSLGSHILIGNSTYYDLRTQSYVTAYGWCDVVGIPVMLFLLYRVCKQVLCWIPGGYCI